MKLLKITYDGLFYQHWSFLVAFSYFIKGIARELKIAPKWFFEWHRNIKIRVFKKRWQKTNSQGMSYFDINGALFSDFSVEKEMFYGFISLIFDDTFLISCFHGDNYDAKIVDRLDKHMIEGPYGYRKEGFDVTVSKNDIVIDVGAWIGDFSAYASSKGATCYAFEPSSKAFSILCKTAQLNKNIYPVQKGIGDKESELLLLSTGLDASNSVVTEDDTVPSEKITIITLDQFVEENKLEKIDFIKADIEGYERNLLKGATQVLKKYAPKIAICTYHLPDDPQVLEKIILEANPDYKIIHLRHKLFGYVV